MTRYTFHRPLRTALLSSLSLAGLALSLTAAAQNTAPNDDPVVFVLDGSNSMWGQIDGEAKISLARGAFGDLLPRIEASRPVGLVAYGHRKQSDCSDIEVIAEPGTGNRDTMIDAVDGIIPRGRTPITSALRKSAGLLPGDGRGSIILVSDGIETCGGDPCALAAELKKQNIDLVAHVVGVDIRKPADKAALACIADQTGGTYTDVDSAKDLGPALEKTAQAAPKTEPAPEPEPVALDPATLDAPDEAELGTLVEVAWTGPGGEFDRIGVYAPGADVRDALVSGLVSKGNPLEVRMPGTEGAYELRYVASDGESVLATRPILLTPVKGAIEAPDSVEAGYAVPVRWATAFDPATDYVTIVAADAADAEYEVFEYLTEEGVILRAPGEGGAYEIRVVREAGDVNTVQERKALTIAPSAASMDAPSSVSAGASFSVVASGPVVSDGGSDVYVTITEPDEGAGSYSQGYDYVYTSGDSVALTAPDAPGTYELRYVIVSSVPYVIARQTLTVQ
ncbi:vWA domain-containing protein [Henriciella litoralis]|uniref:vWA domain-containing protein n=1 Tax=Henriciella litoralis TaxID=568102 RepID=UPI00146D0327|nr:VWA domain-containing protein [Henriciella litoralis]